MEERLFYNPGGFRKALKLSHVAHADPSDGFRGKIMQTSKRDGLKEVTEPSEKSMDYEK